MEGPTPAQVIAGREAAGLTQATAGALVHSHLRTWQKWESGESKMHPAFWELFASRRGLSPCPRNGPLERPELGLCGVWKPGFHIPCPSRQSGKMASPRSPGDAVFKLRRGGIKSNNVGFIGPPYLG